MVGNRRSATYVEFDRRDSSGPGMRAWMNWFRDLGIPAQQVDHRGWVARDPYRNTVSTKVLLWKPDGPQPDLVDRAAATIAYRDDNRIEAQHGVLTVQLAETPPEFPEPELDREESEVHARRSLATIWGLLAQLGDITDDDRPRLAELQPCLDRVSGLLDEVVCQRADGVQLRVGLTYGRG